MHVWYLNPMQYVLYLIQCRAIIIQSYASTILYDYMYVSMVFKSYLASFVLTQFRVYGI